MKKIINNKRASIPITILVLGVFAVCGLALITFTFFGHKSSPLLAEYIEGINADLEKFYFYTSDVVGDSPETAAGKIKKEEDDYVKIEKVIDDSGNKEYYLVIKRKYDAFSGEGVLELVDESEDASGKSILELVKESREKSLVVEFTYKKRLE